MLTGENPLYDVGMTVLMSALRLCLWEFWSGTGVSRAYESAGSYHDVVGNANCHYSQKPLAKFVLQEVFIFVIRNIILCRFDKMNLYYGANIDIFIIPLNKYVLNFIQE